MLCADVSEHSVPSSWIARPIKMGQSVRKLRHIKLRRRGITQKKEYSIQNKAKVLNLEWCHISDYFKVFYIYSSVRASRIKFNNCPTRCDCIQFIIFLQAAIHVSGVEELVPGC